jgi:succinate dehydrogenase / fumarate reductase flavoprotein subunit
MYVDEWQVQEEKELLLRPFESGGKENPYLLHEELQEVMAEHVGITRDQETLQIGLQQVLDLQERAKNIEVLGSRTFNPGWHMARDDLFMLTVAEAVVRAAIARKESRGAQFRTDYPEKSEELGKVNFVACNTEAGMQVQPLPIPPMPRELAAILEETQ